MRKKFTSPTKTVSAAGRAVVADEVCATDTIELPAYFTKLVPPETTFEAAIYVLLTLSVIWSLVRLVVDVHPDPATVVFPKLIPVPKLEKRLFA